METISTGRAMPLAAYLAGLGGGTVAVGGGLAADEDLAGGGEGTDAGGESIPG
jgi:hypothetical protein